MNFTDEEKLLIAKHSKPKGWDEPAVAALKTKIRNYLISQGITQCCYCRRAMHMQFKLDIDTEHVLPKDQFYKYIFDLRNLNISCKRCNMGIKRSDDSFFLGGEDCPNPFESDHYKFIHPNLDVAKHHLTFFFYQEDDVLLVHYSVVGGSSKGQETYEYFRLAELECEILDQAQDLAVVSPELPPSIADEAVEALEEESS